MSSKEINKLHNNLDLSKLFHSGELELLRKKKIAEGFPCWRIIRYQRIIDPEKVPYPLSSYRYVTPKTFEKHLRYFSKDYKIISLGSLLNNLDRGIVLNDKTIVITFDSSWFDTFVYAQPILNRYEIPASCFVQTACIDSNDFHWEDKVIFILLGLKQNDYTIPLFDFFPENLIAIIKELSPNLEISTKIFYPYILCLKSLKLNKRLEALISLSNYFNKIGGKYPDIPNYLTWEEVKNLEKLGMLFGSSSNIPNFFSDLEKDAMIKDISISFKILSEQLQKTQNIFAAPEGEINKNILDATKALGLNYILAGDIEPDNPVQSDYPKVLKRTTLFENNSKTTELLFATLWELYND